MSDEPGPLADNSKRYAAASFLSVVALLLAFLAVFRSEPEPEFSGVSYKRREGPIPKVPQDVWDEARAQFRVRLREIEELRDRAVERRRLEEEKELHRRLWAEAVEEVEAVEAKPRGLFNLFNLLNSDAGTQNEEDQMAAQEAHALQKHHEKKEVTDVKPEKHSLLGKLMKNDGNVDQSAGKVNPNQNRPEEFNEDTEAKKAAMAELLKKGGKGNGEDLKEQFEELQMEAKLKAEKAKKAFEKKLEEEKKRLEAKREAEKERMEHLLKSKKLKERIKIMKEQQVQARVQEDSIQTGISLYCWALMMPFGYEAGLLLAQKKQGVGIFECDEWAVYSNQSKMSNGEDFPFPVNEVRGPQGEPISLFVPLGGRWHTALNRDVFNQVWLKVLEIDQYRKHDWIVKVDPDSVFFPKRLKQVIERRSPLKEVRMQGPEPDQLDCKYCKKKGFEHQSCASHVHWLQSQGQTCNDALLSVSRDPPVDCGCKCNDFACDLPANQAVYINNCQWGLHGPIEVFSRRCIAAYIAGLPICNNLLYHAWGEDIFIDQCMIELGLTRVNEFDVMSEIACGDQPAPCGQTDTTFHPFKNVEKWFACWNFAKKYGHGPEDRLASLVMEQAEIMEKIKREEKAAQEPTDKVAEAKLRKMEDE